MKITANLAALLIALIIVTLGFFSKLEEHGAFGEQGGYFIGFVIYASAYAIIAIARRITNLSEIKKDKITSRYIPNHKLRVLVTDAAVNNKTRPTWDAAIDEIEKMCKLSDEDSAWLSGVRFQGNYTRPY